jgi:hypothetical protein
VFRTRFELYGQIPSQRETRGVRNGQTFCSCQQFQIQDVCFLHSEKQLHVVFIEPGNCIWHYGAVTLGSVDISVDRTLKMA